MEKKVVTVFKDVLDNLRRACEEPIDPQRNGLVIGLMDEDAESVFHALSLFFLYLCDTRVTSNATPQDSLITNVGTIKRWATKVAQRPFAELVRLFKDADNLVTDGRSLEKLPDRSDLATLLFGCQLPSKEWELESEFEINCRRITHERLVFITRLTLRLGSAVNLELIRAFADHDKTVPSYDEMVARDPSVAKVSRIFRHHLDGWDPAVGFEPRFGPGAVAERAGLAGKAGDKFLLYGKVSASQYYAIQKLGIQIPDVSVADVGDMASKLYLVAKDALKKRLICIEQSTVSYVQQGISSSMDTHLRKRGCWFRWTLTDQNRNRGLLSQPDTVTVDLSSASDSVSWDFVKRSSPPRARLAFYACRSQTVQLLPRKQITLRKFASMGSALCFPVMTLLLNCVAWVACVESGLSWGRSSKCIGVFGDDIVVPECAYARLCQLLDAMGFTVNKEKSFNSENPMRETCGWEKWGRLISSPLRISRKYSVDWHRRPTLYQSGIAQLANRAFARGSLLLRAYLCSLGRSARCLFTDDWSSLDDPDLPWEEASSWAIYSPDVSNSHIESEFSSKHRRYPTPDYQRLEWRDKAVSTTYVAVDSLSRYQHALLYPGRVGQSNPATWNVIHSTKRNRVWRAF